jgi:hypothetical protein
VAGQQGYSVEKKGGPGRGDEGGRSPVLIIGIVLVGVATIAVVIALFSIIDFGGSGGDLNSALKAGGCTVKTFPSAKGEASQHLDPNDPKARANVKWDSDPPTHGTHDPVPALWGVYDTEVDQAKLIHNMEHAGIVIQYGPKVPSADVSQLLSDVQKDFQWTVVAPYAKLGDKITFEYWGHLTTCTSYQKPVLTDLRTRRNVPGWSQESQAYPNGRDWTQEARLPGY